MQDDYKTSVIEIITLKKGVWTEED
jgi:hypothetical protein